jgi:hypothetical protein
MNLLSYALGKIKTNYVFVPSEKVHFNKFIQ